MAGGRMFTWTASGEPWSDPVAPCPWIEAACELCQRLRFTGRLMLLDEGGEIAYLQEWSAGEVAGDYLTGEIMAGRLWWGGDPCRCASVRAAQCIPGLDGRITDGTLLHGALAAGVVERIMRMCRAHRLDADVVLRDRQGRVVEVGVVDGEVEATTGEPSLGPVYRAAPTAEVVLGELAKWTRGTYEVRLRPLFSGR